MSLTVLYRGPLSTCNLACPYCPFATPGPSRHSCDSCDSGDDARALARFVSWLEASPEPDLRVFFVPRGEAMVHGRYQQALAHLSHVPHVRKVVVQTNLSGSLDFLDGADPSRLALWSTFHPHQVEMREFLRQCARLDGAGIPYSVGVVGVREHFEAIERLRRALDPSVYLWINACKRVEGYYSEADLRRLEDVDPLFPYNAVRHVSRGLPCRCGHDVVFVEGSGLARRCPFVADARGNLYDGTVALDAAPTPCPHDTCSCHIGYVHLETLGLYSTFGDGVLERIPDRQGPT